MCTYDHIRWYIIHIGLYSYIANITNITYTYTNIIINYTDRAYLDDVGGRMPAGMLVMLITAAGRGRRQSSWRAIERREIHIINY